MNSKASPLKSCILRFLVNRLAAPEELAESFVSFAYHNQFICILKAKEFFTTVDIENTEEKQVKKRVIIYWGNELELTGASVPKADNHGSLADLAIIAESRR
jgi:hypothetical protein